MKRRTCDHCRRELRADGPYIAYCSDTCRRQYHQRLTLSLPDHGAAPKETRAANACRACGEPYGPAHICRRLAVMATRSAAAETERRQREERDRAALLARQPGRSVADALIDFRVAVRVDPSAQAHLNRVIRTATT